MPTVKELKAKLKKIGANYETYKGMRKNELESHLASLEGGGGGGGGGGTVTVAAASAGVKSPQAASPKAPPKKKASPKQTKKAKEFLKKAARAFGTVKSHAALKVGRKAGVIHISPPKGNKTRKATKMDIETEASYSASVASSPKRLFKTRKLTPVSPKEQEITYTNGHKVPVMLKQSILPPGFNPRKEAISKIPGHNHPLDPGASIKFKVTKGNTLYVHDGNMNLLESLHTKAHKKYGKEVETRYGATLVGNLKSNFTKGAISKIKKSQSGGRRTRRRRRRRRRRTRR